MSPVEVAVKPFRVTTTGTLKLTNDNNKPSYKLTFEDAVNIWLRHFNGEFQNRIAASYDVNPGRVNEVLKGRTHPGSRESALASKPAA